MSATVQESKRLKRLEDRKLAIAGQMEMILDNTDEAGDLSEAQEKEFDELSAELDKLNKAIDREEKLQHAELSMKAKTTVEPNIGNPRLAAEKDPMRGFNSPRDFFQSVASAYKTRQMDERLAPLQAAGSDEHQSQDDPYGGFLVPEAMSPDLREMSPESDPMAGRVTNVPMDAPVVNFLARVDKNHSASVSGGLSVSRREETGSISSSRMEMEKIRMEAYSLFGLAYATEELVTDSPRSIAALLEAGFRDEFPNHIIDERINGTGAGEYMGIMNSPCLVSIAKESGQTADTIQGLNVIKMRARCWGYQNAIWIANHDCYTQLIQLHIESPNNAGLIKIYHQSLQEDRPDTLLGRPIFYSEYAKTVGDKGDLILGNWSQYLEGTYQRLQRAESVHVRFLNHERAYKFFLRNAGAPWWRSALTPKNGSDTLSPFVVLDERA